MTRLAQPDPDRPRNGGHHGGRPASANALPTIAVTERALDALVALRTAEHAMPGQALGLVVGQHGSVCLVLDLPGARDRVYSRNDTPIFFVDPEVAARFKGRLLDHRGPPGLERFTFEHPGSAEPPPTSPPRRP
ncbi:MAG TPA: hypothetical protein VH482_35525 [Thermomicrobiales bacterium]